MSRFLFIRVYIEHIYPGFIRASFCSFSCPRLPFCALSISRSWHGLPAPRPHAHAHYQHITFQFLPPASCQLETAPTIMVITIGLIVLFRYTRQWEWGWNDCPQSPSMTTPTKSSLNSGDCHGEPKRSLKKKNQNSKKKNVIGHCASRSAGLSMKPRKLGSLGQRPLLMLQISTIGFSVHDKVHYQLLII